VIPCLIFRTIIRGHRAFLGETRIRTFKHCDIASDVKRVSSGGIRANPPPIQREASGGCQLAREFSQRSAVALIKSVSVIEVAIKFCERFSGDFRRHAPECIRAAEVFQDRVNPGFDIFVHIPHNVKRSATFEFTRFVPSVAVRPYNPRSMMGNILKYPSVNRLQVRKVEISLNRRFGKFSKPEPDQIGFTRFSCLSRRIARIIAAHRP
jgi:hypothetical protein